MISALATPASALTSFAASASHPPRSKLRRQYSAGVPLESARATRALWATVYERYVNPRSSSSSFAVRELALGVTLATAALIPSSDVPDMSPTTTPDDIYRSLI